MGFCHHRDWYVNECPTSSCVFTSVVLVYRACSRRWGWNAKEDNNDDTKWNPATGKLAVV